MEHFIKYVDIHNFKSINHLNLENCKRINLFIGYPNVGKSNVLEALGLFSILFLEEDENLNKLLRVENRNELFYNSLNKLCSISTNFDNRLFDINIDIKDDLNISLHNNEEEKITFQFSKDLKFTNIDFGGHNMFSFISILRYIFNQKNNWKSNGNNYLLPPFGENIIDVLSHNNKNLVDLKVWMKKEFAKFGLEYVLDKSDNSLKVQKRLGSDEVMQLPYSSIADTLQRLIFYKTAIASNENSVLLFEEPEAHAFPPYIRTFTQDVIDAESNQFFIVTHSPLVVNAFLEYEKLRKETSIYLFDFKDNQTTAKRLSDEEMELAYEYGDDLFFNLENLL